MPDKTTKILLAFKSMIEAGAIEVKVDDETLEDWVEQISDLEDDPPAPAPEFYTSPGEVPQSWSNLAPGTIVPVDDIPVEAVDDLEVRRAREYERTLRREYEAYRRLTRAPYTTPVIRRGSVRPRTDDPTTAPF